MVEYEDEDNEIPWKSINRYELDINYKVYENIIHVNY